MIKARSPVALVILDGFGLAEPGPGNAVRLAHTPNFDRLWNTYPATQLAASGLDVGLPEGQIGNSEVGHLNIGAGRVVMQSLTAIDEQIRTGEFQNNEVLRRAMTLQPGATLHLMGLVSGGGVHSSSRHLLALLKMADQLGTPRVAVHAFTDGRDSPPDSGLPAMLEVQATCAGLDNDSFVASVTGRYWAMDRDNRWERTERAYDAVVCGKADRTATSAANAVQDAYGRGGTDEFIEPTVITDAAGSALAPIQDGDSVIFFNFRADRARQLTYALTHDEDWSNFQRCSTPAVRFASLMEYDSNLELPHAFRLPELTSPLALVLSEAGLTQFHAAETEKYAHVTYFFNALEEVAFPGEERTLIASPKVPTYDMQPEMSAPELARTVAGRIRSGADDFVLVNFANPDMVGHTGVLEAAVRACEAADAALGEVVRAMQERGGITMVIADHGNAEKMIADDGVSPHTAHTTNPVPCILVGAPTGTVLRSGGRLADVAPTVLDMLGVEQPAEMTGRSLLL